MKIKSELDKTVAHLRETRKAILGRGGIIEPTCGLRDLPEAVWTLPADVSLAFQEDNSSAYEKIVPSDAEGYAYLSSVGCLTRKNNNLCIADGVYELNNESEKVFDLGMLSYGDYYIAILGDIDGYTGMQVWAENGPIRMYDDSGARECYFTVEEGEDVYDDKLTLMTDNSLNGTIEGIMLCKADEFDKSYKPYQKPFNICIADGYYELSNEPTAEAQSFSKSLGELEEGVYQLALYGDARNVLSLDASGPYVACPQDDLIGNNRVFGVTKACVAFFSMCSPCGYDNMYDRPDEFDESEIASACWSGEITGLMLVKLSDTCSSIEDVKNTKPITNLKYEPYGYAPRFYLKPTGIESRGVNSAEPIDVIEIPEAVQSLEGYGIGISDNECNYIDLRRKVFVNDYEEVSGVVRKRENPFEIDLSLLFPKAAAFLKVEGGGKIIFHNEYKKALPSKIKYMKRMV